MKLVMAITYSASIRNNYMKIEIRVEHGVPLVYAFSSIDLDTLRQNHCCQKVNLS